MDSTIITLIETAAPGWTGCLYGVSGGTMEIPYFIVKPVSGAEARKRYFRIIGHISPDESIADNTNRNALIDFIELTVRGALDGVRNTDRRGNVKEIEYLKGSLSNVLTEGNDDGTLSLEATYYVPENV